MGVVFILFVLPLNIIHVLFSLLILKFGFERVSFYRFVGVWIFVRCAEQYLKIVVLEYVYLILIFALQSRRRAVHDVLIGVNGPTRIRLRLPADGRFGIKPSLTGNGTTVYQCGMVMHWESILNW